MLLDGQDFRCIVSVRQGRREPGLRISEEIVNFRIARLHLLSRVVPPLLLNLLEASGEILGAEYRCQGPVDIFSDLAFVEARLIIKGCPIGIPKCPESGAEDNSHMVFSFNPPFLNEARRSFPLAI
jgi:hypothetical protein